MNSMDLERKKTIIAFLDQLSKGVDPISNTPISCDSVLNNRNISAVLRDASLLISQTANARREAINILQYREKIDIASLPSNVTISEFCSLLNSTSDKIGIKRIRPQWITAWLKQQSYLEQAINSDGYPCATPTHKGKALGIKAIRKTAKTGAIYFVNYYSRDACNFILDNLEAILLAD